MARIRCAWTQLASTRSIDILNMDLHGELAVEVSAAHALPLQYRYTPLERLSPTPVHECMFDKCSTLVLCMHDRL